MTAGWLLDLLWLGVLLFVFLVFALLAMSSRQNDDSDRVADQHDRYLALIPGERRDVTVRRPRPFDWQRDEEAS